HYTLFSEPCANPVSTYSSSASLVRCSLLLRLIKALGMLAQRVSYFSESVIRETSRLAARFNAINLGQGMPDFETSQELKDVACKAIQDGYNQYAVTWGIAPLRQAIAEKMRKFNHLPWVDADEHITVCCGATECMMATMLALINPGDEVV